MKIPENFELIRRVCALYVHQLFSHTKKSVFLIFFRRKFFSYILWDVKFSIIFDRFPQLFT